MKRIFLASWLLLILLVSGCGVKTSLPSLTITNYDTAEDGSLILDTEGIIPDYQCNSRGLKDKILFLESSYCSACQLALPKINEAAKDTGVNITDLDLSKQTDAAEMSKLKVLPYYTPTLVIGCKVYIGGKSKSDYTSILSSFKK